MKRLKKQLIFTLLTLTTLLASAHDNKLEEYVCGTGNSYEEALEDLNADTKNGTHAKIARNLLRENNLNNEAFGYGMGDNYVYEEISYQLDPNEQIIDKVFQVCNWLEVTSTKNQ